MWSLEALSSAIFIIPTNLRIARGQCVHHVLLSAWMALSSGDMTETAV